MSASDAIRDELARVAVALGAPASPEDEPLSLDAEVEGRAFWSFLPSLP